MNIKKAFKEAGGVMGVKYRDVLIEDFNQWSIKVKRWKKPVDKIPLRYAQEYMKKVFFKGGVGSWKKTDEDR